MKNLPLIYFDAKPPKLVVSRLIRVHPRADDAVDRRSDLLYFVEYDAARLVNSENADKGTENRQYQTDEII